MKRFFAKPLYLGRLFGIPIRAHYSWLPVFPFYAWAIAANLLPRETRQYPANVRPFRPLA